MFVTNVCLDTLKHLVFNQLIIHDHVGQQYETGSGQETELDSTSTQGKDKS